MGSAGGRDSSAKALDCLRKGLASRRGELERSILARAYNVSDPTEAGDPDYLRGLAAAVSEAIAFALATIEGKEVTSEAVPPSLLDQARHAARNRVSLDTVLRRYFAGFTVFNDFVIEEAERLPLPHAELQRLLREVASLFDELVVTITAAHGEEERRRAQGSEQRLLERVRALLRGSFREPVGFGYEFDSWHTAAIALGPGGAELTRALAAKLDRRLLLVRPSPETSWAWLGGRDSLPASEAIDAAGQQGVGDLALVVGEPGQGLAGWRLTFGQATAALPVALRSATRHVRYADVALVSSAARDPVLVETLEKLYLAPLSAGRGGGAALIETLSAFFDSGRNVSAASAALGISWPTFRSRLRVVEKKLGRPLESCMAELETAVRLRGLGLQADPTFGIPRESFEFDEVALD